MAVDVISSKCDRVVARHMHGLKASWKGGHKEGGVYLGLLGVAKAKVSKGSLLGAHGHHMHFPSPPPQASEPPPQSDCSGCLVGSEGFLPTSSLFFFFK